MMRLSRLFVFLTLLLSILALAGCDYAATTTISGPPSGSVLFQDDFADPASGWLQGEDSLGKTEYAFGGLRVFVADQVSGKLSIPRLNFTDVQIEVDAIKLAGPDDNDFGIVCRLMDENNFYFFEISSDGYYAIGKYRNNELILLSGDQFLPSEAIRQGAEPNHLRADCVGSKLTMYVNTIRVAEVQDRDFTSGDVGLMAGSFEVPGVDILFDNFTVIQP